MKPENVRLTVDRANQVIEIAKQRGGVSQELVDKYLKLTKSRGVFRMKEMPTADVENLAGEMFYLSKCDQVDTRNKTTYAKLYEHICNYLATVGIEFNPPVKLPDPVVTLTQTVTDVKEKTKTKAVKKLPRTKVAAVKKSIAARK